MQHSAIVKEFGNVSKVSMLSEVNDLIDVSKAVKKMLTKMKKPGQSKCFYT